MQPPNVAPLPQSNNERKIPLATAKYWHDALQSGKMTAAPEIAENSLRECMERAEVNLKELLGSKKDNATLEKELKENIRTINIAQAKENFHAIVNGEAKYPEVFEKKMRDRMKNAGVKDLQELLGEDNQKLEARLRTVIKPHLTRIHLEEARRLYREIIREDEHLRDLKTQVKKIDEHMKIAQEETTSVKQFLDESKPSVPNEDLVAPYRSANGNFSLGHARRLLNELKNGQVPEESVRLHIGKIDTLLNNATIEDKNLDRGLDPAGEKSDDELIRGAIAQNKIKLKEKREAPVIVPDIKSPENITPPPTRAPKPHVEPFKRPAGQGL